MASLKQTRTKIDALQEEIAVVQAAVPPLAEREQLLRQAFRGMLEPFNSLVDSGSRVLNGGAVADFTVPVTVESRGKQAFAGMLAVLGEDAFVQRALERAAEQDRGRLRMPDAEKAAKLLDLGRKLYQAELDEEAIIEETGEARRPGANAAAVLGIPLEVAEEHRLLIPKG